MKPLKKASQVLKRLKIFCRDRRTAKDYSKEHLENCQNWSDPGAFSAQLYITSDIKDLLQPFTTVYPNGLPEPHRQAQKLERSRLISLVHSLITTVLPHISITPFRHSLSSWFHVIN